MTSASGTYTVMTQVAADELGLPLRAIRRCSWGYAASEVSLCDWLGDNGQCRCFRDTLAARALREKLIALATAGHEAPFAGVPARDDLPF